MTRILTTCTLVLALALPAPLAAQSFDQEDMGKALFAAFAAFVVGKIISEASEDGPEVAPAPAPNRIGSIRRAPAATPPVVRQERGGLPTGTPHRRPQGRGGLPDGRIGDTKRLSHPPREVRPELGAASRSDNLAPRWQDYPLPADCRLKPGVYAAGCLIDSMPVSAPLPYACQDRKLIGGRVRNTYDADCLRDRGYRTPVDH